MKLAKMGAVADNMVAVTPTKARAIRRSIGPIPPKRGRRPFARIPSGAGTGAAKGFEFLKEGGTAKDRRIHFFKLRSLLRLIPTTSVLEAIPAISPTLRARIAEVYPYVWDLANPGNRSRPGVEVQGVGPKTEAAIRTLLASKGVKVSW